MSTNDIPEPIFLSAPKAATLCGVSRNTICCWIRDSKLPSYRTAGGKYLIRPVDLQGFMEENQMFVPQSLKEMAEEDEKQNRSTAEKEQMSAPAVPTSSGIPRHEDVVGPRSRQTDKEPAILIVDDDENARMLAVRTVQRLNVQVLEAEDGYEAMHMLVKHPQIALVILDLVMPGKDGVKTFAEIRERDPKLPVIIVTGFPPEESERVFGEMTPDLVISKPYQPAHLLSASGAFLSDIGI